MFSFRSDCKVTAGFLVGVCAGHREKQAAPQSISRGSMGWPRKKAVRSVKLSFPGKGEAEREGRDFKSDQKLIATHKALD